MTPMKPIRVDVTQECIDYGLQHNKHNCATVLGIKLADDDLERIRVDQDLIVASSRSAQERYWWKTPPQVRHHIDQFDADRASLAPFRFTLDPRKATKVKPVTRQSVSGLTKRLGRPHTNVRRSPTSYRPLPTLVGASK